MESRESYNTKLLDEARRLLETAYKFFGKGFYKQASSNLEKGLNIIQRIPSLPYTTAIMFVELYLGINDPSAKDLADVLLQKATI